MWGSPSFSVEPRGWEPGPSLCPHSPTPPPTAPPPPHPYGYTASGSKCSAVAPTGKLCLTTCLVLSFTQADSRFYSQEHESFQVQKRQAVLSSLLDPHAQPQPGDWQSLCTHCTNTKWDEITPAPVSANSPITLPLWASVPPFIRWRWETEPSLWDCFKAAMMCNYILWPPPQM